MYHDIEAMTAADYPFIYGYQAHRLTVVRTWLYNYEESGSLNPMSFMVNAENIYKAEGPPPITEPTTEPTTTTTTTTEEPTEVTPSFLVPSFLVVVIGLGGKRIRKRQRKR